MLLAKRIVHLTACEKYSKVLNLRNDPSILKDYFYGFSTYLDDRNTEISQKKMGVDIIREIKLKHADEDVETSMHFVIT